MKHQQVAPLVVLFLTVTVLIATPVSAAAATTTTGHNITSILDKYPDFSTFNYYLTGTHLASEINSLQNITVLALDNAAMMSFHDKRLYGSTLKNVLSLHVLVEYLDITKLVQIPNGTTIVSSMLQTTGSAGYVNITTLKDRVGFAAVENDGLHSFYVKSIEEKPYVISILQISQPLMSSAIAEAPTASRSPYDVVSILSSHGCKAFAKLLRFSEALSTFTDKFHDGLTVFCPTDSAVNGFVPTYENLTEAEKISLLLYHGVPVFRSLEQLSDGVVNTLATQGTNQYHLTVQSDGEGEDVKLVTKVNTANIVKTLMDVDPFAAYSISNVLMPRELFKGVVEDDTAPAESPKPAKKGEAPADSPTDSHADADSPADGPGSDSEADHQEAANDDNGVSGLNGGYKFIMVFFSLFIGVSAL